MAGQTRFVGHYLGNNADRVEFRLSRYLRLASGGFADRAKPQPADVPFPHDGAASRF